MGGGCRPFLATRGELTTPTPGPLAGFVLQLTSQTICPLLKLAVRYDCCQIIRLSCLQSEARRPRSLATADPMPSAGRPPWNTCIRYNGSGHGGPSADTGRAARRAARRVGTLLAACIRVRQHAPVECTKLHNMHTYKCCSNLNDCTDYVFKGATHRCFLCCA